MKRGLVRLHLVKDKPLSHSASADVVTVISGALPSPRAILRSRPFEPFYPRKSCDHAENRTHAYHAQKWTIYPPSCSHDLICPMFVTWGSDLSVRCVKWGSDLSVRCGKLGSDLSATKGLDHDLGGSDLSFRSVKWGSNLSDS